jgi:sugar lactone lactonase YvrE
MLFRKHIVSSRTLFQLTVAVVFFMVAAVGAAVAANSGNPPLLVPTQVVTVAGITQYNSSNAQVGGFSGDGSTAVETLGSGTLGKKGATAVGGAALNSPSETVVDAVGNLYIADTNNDIIREVNSATGVINTIAGVAPSGCSGTTCTVHYSGCANGVPAYGTPIGGTPYAVQVDNFGNVYYADYKGTVSVIYHSGTKLANFINLVNPDAVKKSGGVVKPGYIYFIAGTVNSSTCAITTSPIVNNAFAFGDTSDPAAPAAATANNIDFISLDSAGNIYLSMGNDASNANTSTAWTTVINTQGTPQTFYQYTVQPGYMHQLGNCNSATTGPCQSILNGIEGIGSNGPLNQLTFGGGQYIGGEVDGYGNFYQKSGSGTGVPSAGYTPVGYAGGPGMTTYLAASAPAQTAAGYSPTETTTPIIAPDFLISSYLPSTYGNVYHVNVTGAIRPDYWTADMYGTMWFMDSNQPLLERIDQFQTDFITIANASALSGRPTTVATLGNSVSNLNGTTSDYTSVASFANPWDCIYGSSPTNLWIQGPQSYDPFGDGCWGTNVNVATNLRFNVSLDSIPNLIFSDYGRQRIRKANVGTQFPESSNPYVSTIPVGTTLTQWVQVHFDASNPPVTGSGATQGSFTAVSVPVPGSNVAYTTNAFSVTPGSDFSIDITTSEFPMDQNTPRDYGNGITTAGMAPWAGLPTCAQNNLTFPDTSWDCLAFVKFAPTQPGLRTGSMVVTTANGSVYNFQLTGQASGSQLSIDGGQQVAVTYTGLSKALGTTSSIAVSPSTAGAAGTLYIADPTNNRIVVQPASGSATTIGPSLTVVLPSTFVGTPVQGLSNPQGVALDAAGNVYISDTGNARVLEYNTATATATVLGNYVWVPGAACDGGTTSPQINVNCVFTAYTSNTTASAQKQSIQNELGAAVTATVAPPQYVWGKPLGLAVDAWGNVFVADAGNASASPAIPPAVVMIPANIDLGGATPLLQYANAPTFTNPVAVAVDSKGFIYVADTSNVAGEVTRIPPGGGDLQPAGTSFPGSALNVVTTLPLFGGQGINNPNGVAVDAAGNVFVSDQSGNAIWEAPAAGPPNGLPFLLNFSGLSSPAGLALDSNGNLYVADSGNKQILVMNRSNPTIPFGFVPESLGTASGVAGTPAGCPVSGGGVACTGVLTITNSGNVSATLSSPFLSTVSSPFSISSNCQSPIPVGTTCTITPLFTPTSTGAQTATVSVNATQSITLTANGGLPEVKIVLTPSNGTGTSPNYTVAAPGAETITATVSQPHVTGAVTPTGTVTFNWTIDAGTPNAGACGAAGTSGPVTLAGGVATYTIPGGLLAGLSYTVSAIFTPAGGDTQDSLTNAQVPILLTVAPTTAEVVTAASVTFQYGQAVPALTGTVSPALPTGVTVTYTSGASQYSNIGTYPIQAVFAGTGFCSYGSPVAYSSGTTPAIVTETAAPLSVSFVVPGAKPPNQFSTVYGAAAFNFASDMVITGAVGSDLAKLSATFSPADSSILNVNGGTPYAVITTMTGKPIGNYKVTITNGTDLVTPAPAAVGITPGKNNASNSTLQIGSQGVVANTAAAIATANYTISVGTQVTAGKGTPSGSVLVYDYFVPITLTNFVPTPFTGIFPVANGAIQWPTATPLVLSGVQIGPMGTTIFPCAVGAAASAACTPVTSVPLAAGNASFVLAPFASGTPSPYYTSTGTIIPGTHYFSFLYSGDAGSNGDTLGDFACSVVGQAATQLPSSLGATQTCPSTGSIPWALVVDNPDFTLSANVSPMIVTPGAVPSGYGIGGVAGSGTQTILLYLGGINTFVGTVNLTCSPSVSYVSCFAGQVTVVNGVTTLSPYSVITLSSPTAALTFDVSTPLTLPIGYFGTTSMLRTTATKTVLAFLPLGLLAFCVRRRRRLSKALWMLIAIAAVGTVMSGCGSNNVQFYTPVPTGPQSVIITATYTSITPNQPTTTRTFVVPIVIN